jgi:ferric-dicitrate binding protein FerR (iron transport regulator)
MAKDNLKEIFKRFYAGIYSRRDEKELLGSQEINSMMETQWDRPEEMKGKVKEPDFDAIFQRIENSAYGEKQVKVRKMPVYGLVAGIALLAGLAAALFFFFPKTQKTELVKYATVAGQVETFTLPDGSTLCLGENSHVSFPARFTENRVVDMEGLAFFKVVKNNTPFKVNAGGISVNVTGTQFSVSSSAVSNVTEATLVEGKVNVTDRKGNFLKELKPDEKLIFNGETGNYQVVDVNAHELVLWKEHKLEFSNSPLAEIADKLADRYGIQARVERNAEKYKFTFKLGTESLEETLRLISSLAPVQASRVNDTLVFSQKK